MNTRTCERDIRAHIADLMRGIIAHPLGTCPERDAKVRAAWRGR